MKTSIEVDNDMATDPRLLKLAEGMREWFQISQIYSSGEFFESGESYEGQEAAGMTKNLLLGGLVSLWCYASRHIREDDKLPIGLVELSQVVGLPPDILQSLPADWLLVRDDGEVELPGYCKKNGITGKKRLGQLPLVDA